MRPLNIKLENFEKTDLKKDYELAKNNPIFVKLVSKLKMSDDVLCNYTSLLETSACEYHNCMNCSALASCQNRIKGHVYIPVNVDGNLQFQYKSCKYYDKMKKDGYSENEIKNIRDLSLKSKPSNYWQKELKK